MSATPEISQVVCSAAAAAQADEHYDPSKDPARKPRRSKDPAWKYAFWPDLQDKLTLQCVLCGKNITSGVLRMKKHLGGGYTEVRMCLKATDEIRKEMHLYMKTNSTKFKAMQLDGDEVEATDGDGGEEAGASSRASNSTAASTKRKSCFIVTAPVAAKRKSKSIADEVRKTPEEVVAERHSTRSTQLKIKDYGTKTKEQKDVVDGHVADFLYENCLPLNVINSRSWEILLESIGQYGSDYITPSYHDVRVPLLEKAKLKTDTLKAKHQLAWKEYGCTLMSDGWTDMSG